MTTIDATVTTPIDLAIDYAAGTADILAPGTRTIGILDPRVDSMTVAIEVEWEATARVIGPPRPVPTGRTLNKYRRNSHTYVIAD